MPDRIDRYRGDVLVASTDPEGGLGNRVPSVIAEALNDPGAGGRWVERRIGGALYDVYCVREHDGHRTVGYLAYGLRRAGVVSGAYLLARVVLATLVLAAVLVLVAMLGSWVAPNRIPWMDIPRPGFRERVIAGFLLVSLLPTVLLGFAGRELFVQERRKEFRSVLEGNLRVAREILSRRLSDAARNAARSEEVRRLVEEPGGGPEPVEIPSPASADALVVVDADGRVVALSPGGEAGVPLLPVGGAPGATYPGYFRREGTQLFACASIPLAPSDPAGVPRTGAVLAFRRVDDTLVSELERRVGSPLSFFAGGRLAATSRPGLYQSEILSDLVDAPAFVAIELEGARTTLVERRVGAGAFLESCGPLPDETNQPAGMIVALSPFPGAGLDPGATRVLSGIYFLCLFVLAAAILAAVLLAGRLTRPIAALTAGAERVGGGELGHRIATRAGGEIGRLIDSFNAMSRRLATSEARDRERREYIEAIIRHVGSGVVSFDRSGRVATVNEAAARILGVDPGDLIGLRPGDAGKSGVVLAEAVPLFGQNAGEIVREIDLPGVAGGEDRTIRLLGTPLSDRSGVPQGAVVVFEDLTELIRSKKITAWAEMARQVAHEIKNPLTPMKLSAQQLREAWRDRHPKFDRILEESAETIIDRCEALRRIAVEFSDYARMPGRRILREDLGSLLGDAGRLCGEAGRGIELRMDLQKDEMPVRIDRDEVMRLFINLLENAVQAMPDGGRLEIAGKVEGDWAVARIGDTGQGIPAPNLERIFEPSFSTKTGGAGLGLPICRAIMEDYDGSIEITSELGRGTLVELHFPLARGDDPAEGEES
ncbi:MAG: ATP-binding protein [Gemmatimonadota bacterium]|nr:ATP-binding protein [Gemmatimonadota bacterium]